MIAEVSAHETVRRLEYTWAFNAWAARAWNASNPVALASAPAFVREATDRLPDVRVLPLTRSAREAAAAAGVPVVSGDSAGSWGSALWATPPVGSWQTQLELAAARLPQGAPFFVLATARLGWLLGGWRAALSGDEAGAAALLLGGKLGALGAAGFRVREVVGLRSPASLAASLAAGIAARAGRSDVADRLEQRARVSFVATGAAAGWSGMVLLEAERQ